MPPAAGRRRVRGEEGEEDVECAAVLEHWLDRGGAEAAEQEGASMDHGPACHGGWEASQVAERDGQKSARGSYDATVREVVLGPGRQDFPGFVDG